MLCESLSADMAHVRVLERVVLQMRFQAFFQQDFVAFRACYQFVRDFAVVRFVEQYFGFLFTTKAA